MSLVFSLANCFSTADDKMNRLGSRAPSQRQLRVAEEVRRVLARIIGRGELNDPTLVDVAVTVSEVRISRDFKNATAFVSPLGGENPVLLVKSLSRAAPFLRQRIGQEMTIKRIPALKFVADPSFDQAQKLNELLATAAQAGKT